MEGAWLEETQTDVVKVAQSLEIFIEPDRAVGSKLHLTGFHAGSEPRPVWCLAPAPRRMAFGFVHLMFNVRARRLPPRSGTVRTGNGHFGGGTRVPKVPSGRLASVGSPFMPYLYVPASHLSGDVVFLPWATNSPSPFREERSGGKPPGPTQVPGAYITDSHRRLKKKKKKSHF